MIDEWKKERPSGFSIIEISQWLERICPIVKVEDYKVKLVKAVIQTRQSMSDGRHTIHGWVNTSEYITAEEYRLRLAQ